MQLNLESNNMKIYKMNKLVQSQISDTWINRQIGTVMAWTTPASLHVTASTWTCPHQTSSPKQQGSNTPGAHESSASLNVNLCKRSNFYKQTVSHTDAPTRRRFYTQMLFTHAHTLSHTNAFTHRRITRTHAFTHKRVYTQTLLHTDAFTRRCFLHTHTRFHTQTLLHTDAFTHRHFYTQALLHKRKRPSQFYLSF